MAIQFLISFVRCTMGDCLDQDDEKWLAGSGDVDSDAASLNEEDVEDNGEQLREQEKKLKRKKKFEEMKAKKKMKKSEDVDDQEAEREVSQLTAEQMLALVQAKFPFELQDLLMDAHQRPKEFTAEEFFCPALAASGTTESTTKKPCPFVRALSVAMPGYKKTLLSTKSHEEHNGCPILLIVCASAQRATEIIKSVSSKLIKCKIAKLFAKHFKVAEQIDMLSKDYYSIAIGTPNRLLKLLEVGALSLSQTSIVLVDHTPDSKGFPLLTQPDAKNDFYRLLYGAVYDIKDKAKIALVKHKQ